MNDPFYVLFDLDGTLVDSAPDLTGALNFTLASLDLPEVEEDSVRDMVGFGARRLIEQGVEAAGVDLNDDEIEAALQTFLDYYAEHIVDRTRPFPGTRKALETLRREGAVMAVCTNKPQALSEAVLQRLKLRHFFGAIVGADKAPERKPHKAHAEATMAAIKANPDQCIFVGDSATDVGAAHNAGLPVVAVSFGYSTTPVAELGADDVVDNMMDLPGAIFDLIDGSTDT